MAWYYGKFSCGCESRVQIYGKTSERQRKADWIFENCKCEDCKRKDYEEKKEKEYQKAIENSKELPELVGTEKQVKWALTLRNRFIEKYNKGLEDFDDRCFLVKKENKEKIKEVIKKLDTTDETKIFLKTFINYFTSNKNKASFWIDNRFSNFGDFIGIILKDLK